jgi:hypothetical protein
LNESHFLLAANTNNTSRDQIMNDFYNIAGGGDQPPLALDSCLIPVPGEEENSKPPFQVTTPSAMPAVVAVRHTTPAGHNIQTFNKQNYGSMFASNTTSSTHVETARKPTLTSGSGSGYVLSSSVAGHMQDDLSSPISKKKMTKMNDAGQAELDSILGNDDDSQSASLSMHQRYPKNQTPTNDDNRDDDTGRTPAERVVELQVDRAPSQDMQLNKSDDNRDNETGGTTEERFVKRHVYLVPIKKSCKQAEEQLGPKQLTCFQGGLKQKHGRYIRLDDESNELVQTCKAKAQEYKVDAENSRNQALEFRAQRDAL